MHERTDPTRRRRYAGHVPEGDDREPRRGLVRPVAGSASTHVGRPPEVPPGPSSWTSPTWRLTNIDMAPANVYEWVPPMTEFTEDELADLEAAVRAVEEEPDADDDSV